MRSGSESLFISIVRLCLFVAWIMTFASALAHQSTPTAICFAAVSYCLAHFDEDDK
jgi:hypothetical protein